jgi:myo-inositol-1(or 4)-monophosphatase
LKNPIFSDYTLAAKEAALKAGSLLKKGFGTSFSISSKEGKHNLVTEYDKKSEELILSFLSSQIKESKFLAEESGMSGASTEDLLWHVDPLDGTVNFAHHIPHFSISIALEKKGEIITAVIYQPMLDELFIGEKGKGAYLNGKKISVSATCALSDSILATGFPYNISSDPFSCIEHFIDIVKLSIPVRRFGSAAIDLAYTACGRFEGFFEVGLSPWDCAAGYLLVEEGGGKVTHWDKSTFSPHLRLPILATNGKIHDELQRMLTRQS